MNPTAILGIASLVIETALTAVKLMKKQKSKGKRSNPHERHKSRKRRNRLDNSSGPTLHHFQPHSRSH
jgi:hypothetical protein